MLHHYKRRLEIYEAVQFIRMNRANNTPEFNFVAEWVKYALHIKMLTIDGNELMWGHKELDRRIKPGNWIVRSQKTGTIKVKSDPDFQDMFEPHETQNTA